MSDKHLERLRWLQKIGAPSPASDALEWAVAEIERLRRGDFTEDEFQNLCHNFTTEDRCRFTAECEKYRDKLFGPKEQS